MTISGAAVIGCGLIGVRRAQALEACGVPVLAVHDLDEPAMSRVVGLLGGRPTAVGTPGEAITADGVQLVVVATNHAGLAPLATLAVTAGRHVLVEKPGASTLEALEGLSKLTAEHGVVVRVGYNHRFHPSIQRVRELLQSDRHGPLLHVRARYGHGGRVGYEREWRAQRELSGGGELVDQGSHLIDLTRHVAGNVELAFSELRTEFWDMDVEDNAYIALRTAGGGWAWLHASWSEWKNTFSFEISLRRAKLEVTGLGGSYGPERLSLYEMGPGLGPPNTTSWEWPPGDDSWSLEIQDVLAEIGGESSVGADIHDAVAAFRIIHEASQ